MKSALVVLLLLAALPVVAAEAERAPIEAATVDGKKVRLFANGRWEYVDAALAVEAKKVADSYPENQPRPAQAQGGLFGVGRTVLPGDKDYNRGSLNPKLR